MISKIAVSLLKPLETSSSIGLFAKDTGGCLLSRLSLARSREERKEVALSEIMESASFYFISPLLSKLSKAGFSKIEKNAELVKFAQILSTFGIVLPFIYAIPKIRNNMTLSDSGKDEFVSVVGLKNTKTEEKTKTAKEKNNSLLKKSFLFSLSSLALVSALLLSSKNEKIYKKLEPLIKKLNEKLDFSPDNDLKLIHYGALIYPVSILGYFKASRDKYEKEENARRFSVSVPLLFFGDKVIEKPIYKFFDKKFNTSLLSGNSVKTYDDILKMPKNLQKQALKSKNFAFGIDTLISTVLVAIGVTLLNRIETKKNYNKDNSL